jgi:hypothetical protein
MTSTGLQAQLKVLYSTEVMEWDCRARKDSIVPRFQVVDNIENQLGCAIQV